ncbi:hypothetical protein MYAM1_002653 [Malassezia yamatoensis]|uniref:J domain-containing protein n=1 Tax=Malassezia yamatoensis TaxID=253288 RepID=A0AAJ5YYI2_9BASI|nr:hypothetical protein MYAM1_002653 [Malassezia yamatoensis]
MQLRKILGVCLCLFAGAFVSATQWSKEDIEIFELQHALEQIEGAGTNFYSIMGLKPSASLGDIRKAYREKSLEWHPDKNSGVANAYKRFEQLGLIHKILRDERRDRYNHFLTHGFPKWRNTGYYYERYRPGILSVLVLIVLLSVGAQYLVQTMNWRRDKERIENLRRSAYAVAWGAWFQTPADAKKGIKPKTRPQEKKVRVPLSGYPNFPKPPSASAVQYGTVDWDQEGEKVRKAVTAAPLHFPEENRLLDVTVYGDGSMAAYNPSTQEWFVVEAMNDQQAPSLRTTWPFKLVQSMMQKPAATPAESVEESAAETGVTPTAETTSTTSHTPKTSSRRRQRTTKN